MKHLKIFKNLLDYNNEIEGHKSPILPNISYIEETDEIKYNANPIRKAHFSITSVTDNLLFEDVRGLKGIYINGSEENVCPQTISPAVTDYEFELLLDDLIVFEDMVFVQTPNKLFTGTKIEKYLIKTNTPISMDYYLDITQMMGAYSGGLFACPLMPYSTVGGLISENLIKYIDEYTIDVSALISSFIENYENIPVNLGIMLWDETIQNHIPTTNIITGLKTETQIITTITKENVNDVIDGWTYDIIATNQIWEFEEEILNNDIIITELSGEMTVGDFFSSEDAFLLGLTLNGKYIYARGSWATIVIPILVTRDGVPLNATLSGTVIDMGGEPQTVPFGVDAIGEYDILFELKDRFRTDNIIFSSNLTELSDDALYYCENISSDMFYNIPLLTKLTIPSSIKTVENNAFSNNYGHVIDIHINNLESYCNINWMNFGSTIRANGGLILNNKKLEKLYIPKNITSIKPRAFLCNKYLKKVVLHDNVDNIGEDAFYCCYNIEEVNFGEGLIRIEESAFNSCNSLTKIKIPDSVTNISDSAFGSCDSLIDVTLSNNLKYLGERAFNYCENLESIILPDSLEYIDRSAFGYCRKLNKVILGKKVNDIYQDAFENCTNLKYIELPDTLTNIDRDAFYNTALQMIKLPEKLTSIGNNAFAATSIQLVINNSSLNITTGSTSNGSVARYAKAVVNKNDERYENCVFKTIDNWLTLVYYDGSNNDVILPNQYNNNAYSIGNSAFACNQNIKSVTFPSRIIKITDYAFYGCDNLKTIICPKDFYWAELNHYSLDGLPSNGKVYGSNDAARYIAELLGWKYIITNN